MRYWRKTFNQREVFAALDCVGECYKGYTIVRLYRGDWRIPGRDTGYNRFHNREGAREYVNKKIDEYQAIQEEIRQRDRNNQLAGRGLPPCIPENPEIVYADQWKGWDDFLGTKQTAAEEVVS